MNAPEMNIVLGMKTSNNNVISKFMHRQMFYLKFSFTVTYIKAS